MIRVKDYDRRRPPSKPTDWSDKEFGWIMVLFVLNWVASVSPHSLL